MWILGQNIKAGMRVIDKGVTHTVKEVYSRRISGLGTKYVVQMAVINGPDLRLWRNHEYEVETV